jgi:hypothetical protein
VNGESAAAVTPTRGREVRTPVTERELSWLRHQAVQTLGLRDTESETLLLVLQIQQQFSYNEIALRLGRTREGVRLALQKFERRGLLELCVEPPREGSGLGRVKSFRAYAGPTLRVLFDRLLQGVA